MTYQQFGPIFAMLAMQLRAADADIATAKAYFPALEDLEVEFVEESARRLARKVDEDGKSWFPKSAEWRAAALKVEADRIEAQRTLLRKLPKPLCAACDDTGWESCGDGVRPCACRSVRRLEVLGRRPWPALPEASL
jgi:hypothetical protein